MRRAALACVLVVLAASAAAQPPGLQMPDPKQMSGVPLPSADLQVGTLTVRVIRGSLSNPITGQQVELTGDETRAATTNESGRAEFSGLRAGSRIRANSVVNGEKLESQEIQVPSSGGIRIMLVATDPEASKRAEEDRRLAQGPAQPGMVVLGDQSRFVFELGDQAINVFNIIQVLNTARVPVVPPNPIVFELPKGAENAALLEGSSPLAVAAKTRVEVKGPFPPGVTLVQFAYAFPYSGGSTTLRQVLPAQMAQLTVVAQKVGDLRLSSGQLSQQREMSSEGQTYILGLGPAVPAGGEMALNFTGLPHSPTWPRNTALALAVLILVAGAVLSLGGKKIRDSGEGRQELLGMRERLFNELAALETSHRAGKVAAASYASRRQALTSSLERIYAALDDDHAENAAAGGL